MNYSQTRSAMPIQKLPMSKKTEEWQKQCVDYIIGMGESTSGGQTRSRFEELQTYYNLYNGIFDEKDLKAVTNPFKVEEGFPATPQNMNVIRSRIDLLIGEETKRPDAIRIVRTSDSAASELQETSKNMLIQYVMATIMSGMSEEEAIAYQQGLESGEIMPPESIAKYMQRDHKDIAENIAYHAISYLKQQLNLNNEFLLGWKDALIAGMEVYYVGIQNEDPYMERVNPLYFAFDKSPDLQFIEDGDWACRRMRLSYTDIYDRFYDKLDESQLDKLLDLVDQRIGAGNYGPDKPMIDNYVTVSINDRPSNDMNEQNTVNVWHATWKSFKLVYFVTYLDENGEVQTTIVDENYTKNGTEISVEKDWIIEVWEGYRAGAESQDLYFGIQPLEYQHVSVDNPNSQKLPYCGAIYSNTNSMPKSLVSIMKPLQYMYIIIWYRLELTMARDKGKVVNMDITQIPKSMGIDVAKWMHYLSAIGVNFINPYEEGWDIPGREGGKPAQFNQITALDLTMANVIDGYVNLMSKLEQMIGDLTGITQQRMGAISTRELVGNVERSVVQSAHVTEPMFWVHSQCKRNALNNLLNVTKHAWSNSGKTKLHYIYNDVERAFLDIDSKFYNEDYDIFLSDSTKDMQNIEALKQLIQPAMQNGASLLDAVEILTSDNLTTIKNRLKEIEQINQERIQQAQQQEQEITQQSIQMEQEKLQQELTFKEAELDLKRYEVDQNNATRITVAQLTAYRGVQEMDQDQSGVPDVIEIGNQALEQQRLQSESFTKSREIEYKKEIEDRKIDLEKQKMTHEKQLQQQKDKAAMEREKLKARTALKNPVAGERKSKK